MKNYQFKNLYFFTIKTKASLNYLPLNLEHNHEKEYLVKVDKALSQTIIDRMSKGVPILDTITKECKIKKSASNEFKIILTHAKFSIIPSLPGTHGTPLIYYFYRL